MAEAGDAVGGGVGYLICTTPRSGSWLLCEALAHTDVAGLPQEYLMCHVPFDAEWGVPTADTFDDYVAWVQETTATSNGVVGIKVHWAQWRHLQEALRTDASGVLARLEEALPDLLLVRLRRQDRLRQALSYHRALQDQRWWRLDEDAPSQADVALDVGQVDRLQRLLERHDEHWTRLLAGRPRVLELTYEALVADVPGTTATVLHALGVPADEARAAVADVRPQLQRQAGAQTEQWVHETLSWRRRRQERAEATL